MRESDHPERLLSFEEYMAWEERSPRKHEFVRGEVYPMAAVTLRHDAITLNLLVPLRAAARRGPCTAHSSDVKVEPILGIVYYPDVSVDCVPHHPDDLIIDQPCLVVEVTSRSTARTDRGEKLENYRRAPSLRMYLIIDHRRRRVTCHRRDDAGEWIAEDLVGTGSIAVPCPAITLTLDEIYEGVEMPPIGVAEPELDDEDEYVVEG